MRKSPKINIHHPKEGEMRLTRQAISNRADNDQVSGTTVADTVLIPGMGKVIDTPLVSMQIPTHTQLQDINRTFGDRIGKKYFTRETADIDCTRAFLHNAHEEMRKKVRTLLLARSNITHEPVALIVLQHPNNVICPNLWFAKEVDGCTEHSHEEILETLEAMRTYTNQFLEYDYIYFIVSKNDVSLKNVLREMGALENTYKYVEIEPEGSANFLVSFRLTR